MIEYTVAQELSFTTQAMKNCSRGGNKEWYVKHGRTIKWITDQFLPHGSGIDSGCKVDLERSSERKLVIHTSYHHMHESGMYDGWTDYTVVVTPAFRGVDIRIAGRDRNQIKEYLTEVFDCALSEVCHRIDPEKNTNELGWYFNNEWKKREET